VKKLDEFVCLRCTLPFCSEGSKGCLYRRVDDTRERDNEYKRRWWRKHAEQKRMQRILADAEEGTA
jgi:hypothetical protein